MVIRRVFIKRDALEFMSMQILETNNEVETGGVLMGYTTIYEEVVVTCCNGPGINTIQNKNSITFDIADCQHFVNFKYEESEGRITYLGDWHSHTTKRLFPSKTDNAQLKSVAESKEVRLSNPLMLIMYQDSESRKLKCYSYEHNGIYEIREVLII